MNIYILNAFMTIVETAIIKKIYGTKSIRALEQHLAVMNSPL